MRTPTNISGPTFLLWVVALGGCQAILGIDDTKPRSDAAPADAADAAPPECPAWTPVHFDPCAYVPGDAPILADKTDYQLDTDTGRLTGGPVDVTLPGYDLPQPTGDALLLAFLEFTVPKDTTLRVVGSRPLIIASWSNIEIRGTVDVSSSADDAGAGAASALGCEAMPGQSGNGGGGGGGGGFGDAGGAGGAGNDNGNAGGAGGTAIGAPATVRAGCPGAAGGEGPAAATPGAGGLAGGAVQWSAYQTIEVFGVIDAGGGGGGGGTPQEAGGGGGGSGGYIGFDAARVLIMADAIVGANGGGGGEGADTSNPGNPGEDGRRDITSASGGAGAGGGDGGSGSSAEVLDGQAGKKHDRGGGGGGGGAGHVLSYVVDDTSVDDKAKVSPPIQFLPRP